MTLRRGRTLMLAASLIGGLAVAGCAPILDHQGYIADDVLAASIQPGVDNRASVEGTLGRPSFTGQFDKRDWYYVSRYTKGLAFNKPKPSAQTVLHVRFDEAGNVTAVEKTGLEQIAAIDPSNDKTPTLGRDKGFFEELFGNIGQVGSGVGKSADDPR